MNADAARTDEWLSIARGGYCASTSGSTDCSKHHKGSWPLNAASGWTSAAAQCLELCRACASCHFITVSLPEQDCSWYAKCDVEHLHTELGGADRFRSAAVATTSKWQHRSPRQSHAPQFPEAALFAHAPPLRQLNFHWPVDRYAPSTFSDAMAAVYTTWNVLDRMVLAHNVSVSPWAFGMFLPIQVEKLVRAVRAPGVTNYCEVGFNGGHTAAAVLSSTAKVRVRSYDSAEYGQHTERNAAWLMQMHPQRFHFTKGDSSATLPLLSARVAAGVEPPCDVVLVDGSHDEKPTYNDLYYFRRATTPGGLVILDDLDTPSGLAVLRAYREGWITLPAWFIYHAHPTPAPMACVECPKALPNVTVVHDPKRLLMPCMRWIVRGCQKEVLASGSWNRKRCQRCDSGSAWGLGKFVAA